MADQDPPTPRPTRHIASYFWPDHKVRCVCGRDILLKDAKADGWVDIEDLPQGKISQPLILTGVCWICDRNLRSEGL